MPVRAQPAAGGRRRQLMSRRPRPSGPRPHGGGTVGRGIPAVPPPPSKPRWPNWGRQRAGPRRSRSAARWHVGVVGSTPGPQPGDRGSESPRITRSSPLGRPREHVRSCTGLLLRETGFESLTRHEPPKRWCHDPMSSNGRTPGRYPGDRGSNPCIGAAHRILLRGTSSRAYLPP